MIKGVPTFVSLVFKSMYTNDLKIPLSQNQEMYNISTIYCYRFSFDVNMSLIHISALRKLTICKQS